MFKKRRRVGRDWARMGGCQLDEPGAACTCPRGPEARDRAAPPAPARAATRRRRAPPAAVLSRSFQPVALQGPGILDVIIVSHISAPSKEPS